MFTASTAKGATGHPYAPIRAMPRNGRRVGYENRVAWMLRASRRYGGDERYRRMATFAEDLGRLLGRPVPTSQVSRWESGKLAAGYPVLRGYEQILGLAPDSLVGVTDALFRHGTVGLAPSRLRRDLGGDPERAETRIEVLLERALSGGVMAGSDWDELTALLTAVGTVILRPRDWTELVNRLLGEQLISNGSAWRARNEATHRLLWLPRSRPHVIAACAALVRDTRSQVLVEPLAILDMACHPSALGLLVEQVTNPTNDQALRGALLASIGQVRTGHYSPQQLARVTAAVVELLLDTAVGTAARPLAAEVLRELPAGLRQRMLRRVRPALVRDPSLANIFASGRTVEPAPAAVMVARVVAGAMSHLPDHLDPPPDDLLPTLVSEILYDPNPDVRMHAAQMIGATPLAASVAEALCAEIVKPGVTGNSALASAILDAMPFIGGQDHRSVLERIVVAEGLAPSVVTTAAWRLGHVPGASEDSFWWRVLDHHRRAWKAGGSAANAATLRGLVYGLGIAGHARALCAVAADPSMPGEARAAARWWQNLPELLTTNARR